MTYAVRDRGFAHCGHRGSADASEIFVAKNLDFSKIINRTRGERVEARRTFFGKGGNFFDFLATSLMNGLLKWTWVNKINKAVI